MSNCILGSFDSLFDSEDLIAVIGKSSYLITSDYLQ